jgi:hypothetical protein
VSIVPVSARKKAAYRFALVLTGGAHGQAGFVFFFLATRQCSLTGRPSAVCVSGPDLKKKGLLDFRFLKKLIQMLA